MPGVRFNTDQAVFAAFPGAPKHIATKPMGLPPFDFLERLLVQGKLDEAISFCAYLLPRREAVAWGCRVFRSIDTSSERERERDASLDAAEAWTANPTEDLQRTADTVWQAADREVPQSWMAFAAARSGRRPRAAGEHPYTDGPQVTAHAVRTALLLKLHRIPSCEKSSSVRQWIALGVKLAESGL